MRVPDSRHPSYGTRHTSGAILFIAIVGGIGILATVTYFVLTSGDGILALPAAEETESALEAWQARDYQAVAELTGETLQQRPLDYEALVLNGFAKFYLSLEQVDVERQSDMLVSSIVALRRANLTRSDRFQGQLHAVLGKAYFHRGQYFYDMTVRHLERAVEMGQSDSDIYEYLAVANRDLGNTGESIRYFDMAIDSDPNAMYALAVAEMLTAGQDYTSAERYLETARALPGADSVLDRIDLLTGRLLRETGRREQAVTVYEQILERNPNSAEAHFGLGETYLAMDMRDRARYEWREALRLDPNHIESLQRLQEY